MAGALRLPQRGGVAAVGDSLTMGDGNPRIGLLARNSWLTHVIRQGIPYGFSAATGGALTSDLAAQLPHALRRNPVAVAICAGTNDLIQRRTAPDAVEYLAGLLPPTQNADAVPILATLPPVIERPDETAAFNHHIRALAAAEDLPLIDFHAAVTGPDGQFLPGLAADGVHPTTAGAKRMAEAALPVIRSIIR